jgi:hypothetical protein
MPYQAWGWDMLIFEIVGIVLIFLCICPLFLGGEIVSH